jgi:hypothetical protein
MCRNIRTLYNFEPPATERLLDELTTKAPPKDREREAAKRRARAERRFAAQPG